MPNYYSPGVYIEEVNKGPRPIEAVATSVAAFVGFAPYSSYEDANRPVLITSWTQYVEKFGLRQADGRREPFMKDAYMSHVVYGYFLNGGTRCYVVRVAPPEWMAGIENKALSDNKVEVVTAKSKALKEGPDRLLTISSAETPQQDIEISIDRTPGSAPTESRFNLRVKMGEQNEEFKNIDLRAPEAPADEPPANSPPDGAPPASSQRRNRQADAAAQSNGKSGRPLSEVNKGSKLIRVKLEKKLSAAMSADELDPVYGMYYIGVPQPKEEQLALIKQRDIVGDAIKHTGMVGLELAPDVTMVCCPDLMSPLAYEKTRREEDGSIQPEKIKDDIKTVQIAMINYCELSADRLAILDAPRGFDPQGVESWRLNDAGYDSMFAALYYPWITIDNPLAGPSGEPKQINVPPCGHIAGIYARNDAERGVHKAPANEIVRGALKPEREITRGEQDGLNPIGINCIRAFPGRGIRVWGARTLTSDPAWRYINVRRLFNMVEKSIERDTQWVVFEPNDPDLWSRVRRDVGAFLTGLWRDGMLFGNTPEQAFYVKCDEELNPPASRDLGRLIIEVGMAPVKPAEFVIFRFSQYTAEAA